MSAPMPTTHSRQRFTWSDYRTWPEGERWELIDGIAYAMAPAPSTRHQMVTLKFASRLEQKLADKRCRPFTAPIDIRLSEHDVVQPDVLVVCDPAKIAETHIEGAPEVVVEVLSPSTAARDLREKKALYERFGVREYVVVDPLENYVQRYGLGADGKYGAPEIFGPQETLPLRELEDITLDLWEVFELPPPETALATSREPSADKG